MKSYTNKLLSFFNNYSIPRAIILGVGIASGFSIASNIIDTVTYSQFSFTDLLYFDASDD